VGRIVVIALIIEYQPTFVESSSLPGANLFPQGIVPKGRHLTARGCQTLDARRLILANVGAEAHIVSIDGDRENRRESGSAIRPRWIHPTGGPLGGVRHRSGVPR
jgi:hypothetical protein